EVRRGGAPGLPSFSDAADAPAPAPGDLGFPAGPTTGPAPGAMTPPPRRSDDTAILTPQQPAPGPPPAGGHVSGDTLTSGIPVVPPEHRRGSPFPASGPARVAAGCPAGPGAPADGGPGRPAAPEPAPAPRPAPAAAPKKSTPGPQSAKPAKKKGRSKVVLLGAGAVGLLGVAYGAGLLLNHSEVPKGTAVLGVDIGGGTSEEAVRKLDTAFGERAAAPLKLKVGGKEEQLTPDRAGLSLDTEETVRGASGADYNPVSVIGSLFGGDRVADPVIKTDEEKLGVALTDLAGSSGSATEGTIVFAPGKVTPVPGKAGQALDVQRSLVSVRDAFRTQVETGQAGPVELPVTTRQPTVDQAELDRAMKEFAEPAMSDLVTIKAGGRQIQFGPNRSLPQILSMKAVDGRLVEVYDKKAIDKLLDGVFDGVMVTKGDGRKHQLSADDVAHALQTALLGKTPAERTQTIALDGEG
uniref:hypothetical protein n=1 Tax=Streptomyces solincola TaxID=2100817 RepID=UPI00215976E7